MTRHRPFLTTFGVFTLLLVSAIGTASALTIQGTVTDHNCSSGIDTIGLLITGTGINKHAKKIFRPLNVNLSTAGSHEAFSFDVDPSSLSKINNIEIFLGRDGNRMNTFAFSATFPQSARLFLKASQTALTAPINIHLACPLIHTTMSVGRDARLDLASCERSSLMEEWGANVKSALNVTIAPTRWLPQNNQTGNEVKSEVHYDLKRNVQLVAKIPLSVAFVGTCRHLDVSTTANCQDYRSNTYIEKAKAQPLSCQNLIEPLGSIRINVDATGMKWNEMPIMNMGGPAM